MKEIVDHFPIGRYIEHTKLSGGKTSDTYLIKTDIGKFVLQQLNEIYNESMIRDHIELYFLISDKIKIPECVNTRENKYVLEYKDKFYRVMKHIESDEKPSLNNKKIKNMSKVITNFHNLTENITKLRYNGLKIHDRSRIKNQLILLKEKHSNTEKWKIHEDIYDYLLSEIQKYKLPKEKQLIHGDMKFNNFLFKNDKVVGLVDIASLMIRSKYYDIGDFLRNVSNNQGNFDIKTFNYGLNCFDDINYGFAIYATKLIGLELCSRYLIDIFELNYFKFDENKFKNLEESNESSLKRHLKFYMTMNEMLPN